MDCTHGLMGCTQGLHSRQGLSSRVLLSWAHGLHKKWRCFCFHFLQNMIICCKASTPFLVVFVVGIVVAFVVGLVVGLCLCLALSLALSVTLSVMMIDRWWWWPSSSGDAQMWLVLDHGARLHRKFGQINNVYIYIQSNNHSYLLSCWDYMPKSFVEVMWWYDLLRLSVEICCRDHLWKSIDEISCWAHHAFGLLYENDKSKMWWESKIQCYENWKSMKSKIEQKTNPC